MCLPSPRIFASFCRHRVSAQTCVRSRKRKHKSVMTLNTTHFSFLVVINRKKHIFLRWNRPAILSTFGKTTRDVRYRAANCRHNAVTFSRRAASHEWLFLVKLLLLCCVWFVSALRGRSSVRLDYDDDLSTFSLIWQFVIPFHFICYLLPYLLHLLTLQIVIVFIHHGDMVGY